MTNAPSNPDVARKIAAPIIAPENKPFWDAANEGALLIKHCRNCRKLHWYPRALCPWCLSADTEWRKAVGTGSVYSYSFSSGVIVAYVRLSEGITLLSNLIDSDAAQVRVDAPVRLCFATAENGQKIPMFTLSAH